MTEQVVAVTELQEVAMSKDAWIKRLDDENADIVRRINELKAKRQSNLEKERWLKSWCRYGDIVVQHGVRVVVLGVDDTDGIHGRELNRFGRLGACGRWLYEDESTVVGSHTGPDLPPKPPEAEWAEKVLDGEIPAPEDPNATCDYCGLPYDVPGSNEKHEGFCWCTHCDRCDVSIGDTDDLYCDTCSREAETPEDYHE